MINFHCVRVGEKYDWEYVRRLANMVHRHYDGEYRFCCLTDNPQGCPVTPIVLENPLPRWWSKLYWFNPSQRQDDGYPSIYIDLDTVICGSLNPLVEVARQHLFAICENFTKLNGHPTWPCNYGSCVMTLTPGQSSIYTKIGREFAHGDVFERYPHGDQQLIEAVYPNATYLQDVLPPGYMIGYRDFPDKKPDNVSLLIFAGSRKPHTCNIDWIREEWR